MWSNWRVPLRQILKRALGKPVTTNGNLSKFKSNYKQMRCISLGVVNITKIKKLAYKFLQVYGKNKT